MNIKKYIIGAGLVSAILGGAALVVLAQDLNQNNNMGQNTESMKMEASREMAVRAGTQMVLEVNHQGKVLMRGSIESIGSGSLTVKSWGGSWIVNISSATKLLPGTDMSQFKIGDFVGVQGAINTGSSWMIDATIVRDWAAKKIEQMDKKTEQENKEMMRKQEMIKKEDEVKPQVSGGQGLQQKIDSILEQIKKIQEQIKAQQTTSTPAQ